VQQVEQERGLLDGVRALDHHGPGRPRRELPADRGGQLDDVVDGQRGAGQLAELAHLDPGAGAVEPGHRVEQLPPGQHRARRHGDGAAEGEHRDPGGGSRRDSH
jgi:hypothetical protein